MSKLGIIAGSGKLPQNVAKAAQNQGCEVFVVALEGQTDELWLSSFPHDWHKLGQVQKVFDSLKNNGVDEVILIGAVKRPSIFQLGLDARATKIVSKHGMDIFKGDDALLRVLMNELEGEGFKVRAANDFLDTTAPLGVLGQHQPDDLAQQDIKRGVEILHSLAPHDVGQAVVVQQGMVLGIEAAEGTDGLLERVKKLKRDGAGGIAVKLFKTTQDKRVDMPTIGPGTVEKAHSAGLRGIAFSAGKTQLVDQEELIEKANKLGLFLVGIK
ncbi:MAG: LpxI family protein [Dongiaceae bacterium]